MLVLFVHLGENKTGIKDECVEYYADIEILNSLGIDISSNTGQFDLIIDTPSGRRIASTLHSRFEKVISSKNWKSVGQKMYKNIGRFN